MGLQKSQTQLSMHACGQGLCHACLSPAGKGLGHGGKQSKKDSFNQAESFSVDFFFFPVFPGILKPNTSQLVC